ncbi:MAG: AAA family ATPase [Alphaproteobacteria bacterium]
MSSIQIVITGGPCAGKTTCLSILEQRLTEKGYKVITVSEAATEMTLSGIQAAEIGLLAYEKLLIGFQLDKEKIAKKAADLYPKSVILLDRGLPDCLAYMTKEDYEKEIRSYNLFPNEALNRYDAVFHLVTAAKGAEEFYTCHNNLARREKNLELARSADERTQQAYVGHPHLRVINNSTTFQEKINRLCKEVFAVLGIPVPLEIERKFLIRCPDDNVLKEHGAVPQKIVQAYLKSNGKTQRRIRERGNENGFTCFYTEKETLSPTKRIERERKIQQKEYLSLLTEAEYLLTKTRWCFVDKGQYFELDTFDACPDQALLEIELTQENQQITLPDWITLIQEVTDLAEYRNYSIAQKGFPRSACSKYEGF